MVLCAYLISPLRYALRSLQMLLSEGFESDRWILQGTIRLATVLHAMVSLNKRNSPTQHRLVVRVSPIWHENEINRPRDGEEGKTTCEQNACHFTYRPVKLLEQLAIVCALKWPQESAWMPQQRGSRHEASPTPNGRTMLRHESNSSSPKCVNIMWKSCECSVSKGTTVRDRPASADKDSGLVFILLSGLIGQNCWFQLGVKYSKNIHFPFKRCA